MPLCITSCYPRNCALLMSAVYSEGELDIFIEVFLCASKSCFHHYDYHCCSLALHLNKDSIRNQMIGLLMQVTILISFHILCFLPIREDMHLNFTTHFYSMPSLDLVDFAKLNGLSVTLELAMPIRRS